MLARNGLVFYCNELDFSVRANCSFSTHTALKKKTCALSIELNFNEGAAFALVSINRLTSSKVALWIGKEEITQPEDKRNFLA